MALPVTKESLRKLSLASRMSLSKAEQESAALGLRDTFLKSVDLPTGCSVSAYIPYSAEISALPLCDALIGRGHPILMPAGWERDAADLTVLPFRSWTRETPMYPNQMGIYEPDFALSTLAIPDILLVPTLAFDLKGNRLNFGTGYWDRTFWSMAKGRVPFKAIGIAYDSQLYGVVPVDENDYTLDMVVTETKAYKFR